MAILQKNADVLSFITNFKGAENVFLDGMCYWFSIILQKRFPGGSIVYDMIHGHFLYAYGDYLYDVIGQHNPAANQGFITLKDIKLYERALYKRLRRDCVLKLS